MLRARRPLPPPVLLVRYAARMARLCRGGAHCRPRPPPARPLRPPACLCPTQLCGGRAARVYKGARWPAPPGFELSGCAEGALLGLCARQPPAHPAALLPLLRAAAARAAHGVGLPTLYGWNFWPPPAPHRARIHGERHGSPPLASTASRRGGWHPSRHAGIGDTSGPEPTAARPRLMMAGSGSLRKAKPPSGVLRSLAERASTCRGQSRADGSECEQIYP